MGSSLVFRTKSDHTRFHRTGVMFQMSDNTYISPVLVSKKCICPKCGAIKYKKSKLCTECRLIEEQLKDRPTKEELIKLLSNGNSREKIGRMYNVTGNTVKKWQIKFGLL